MQCEAAHPLAFFLTATHPCSFFRPSFLDSINRLVCNLLCSSLSLIKSIAYTTGMIIFSKHCIPPVSLLFNITQSLIIYVIKHLACKASCHEGLFKTLLPTWPSVPYILQPPVASFGFVVVFPVLTESCPLLSCQLRYKHASSKSYCLLNHTASLLGIA